MGKKTAALVLALGIVMAGEMFLSAKDKKDHVKGNVGEIAATTTATPKIGEGQVVVTGTIICTSCNLKKQKGAKSQCSVYGCDYKVSVEKVLTHKGKKLKDEAGKIYSILANDASAPIKQKKNKGKKVIIAGKIYPEEQVIEVEFVKYPKKKTYTCSMCGGDYDKPGTCPKCNMNLIEKKKKKK